MESSPRISKKKYKSWIVKCHQKQNLTLHPTFAVAQNVNSPAPTTKIHNHTKIYINYMFQPPIPGNEEWKKHLIKQLFCINLKIQTEARLFTFVCCDFVIVLVKCIEIENTVEE